MTIDAQHSTGGAPARIREREVDPFCDLLSAVGGGLILRLEQKEEGTTVHLQGALDLAGAGELGATIEHILSYGAGRVVVDATTLSFVDLSGYCALLACVEPQPVPPSRDGVRVVLRVGEAVTRLRHLVDLASCHLDQCHEWSGHHDDAVAICLESAREGAHGSDHDRTCCATGGAVRSSRRARGAGLAP